MATKISMWDLFTKVTGNYNYENVSIFPSLKACYDNFIPAGECDGAQSVIKMAGLLIPYIEGDKVVLSQSMEEADRAHQVATALWVMLYKAKAYPDKFTVVLEDTYAMFIVPPELVKAVDTQRKLRLTRAAKVVRPNVSVVLKADFRIKEFWQVVHTYLHQDFLTPYGQCSPLFNENTPLDVDLNKAEERLGRMLQTVNAFKAFLDRVLGLDPKEEDRLVLEDPKVPLYEKLFLGVILEAELSPASFMASTAHVGTSLEGLVGWAELKGYADKVLLKEG